MRGSAVSTSSCTAPPTHCVKIWSARSLVALSRRAVPLMEKKGGGSILTLTYLGSDRVFTNYNVMGVAKAALESSVRYLASDLGPKNIRVNAISAGAIKTLAAAGISGFSSMLQVYRDRAPLRRGVDQSEVADTAVFLLGPGARGITGAVGMVDAGFHAVAGGRFRAGTHAAGWADRTTSRGTLKRQRPRQALPTGRDSVRSVRS